MVRKTLLFFLMVLSVMNINALNRPIVIAHRGASGYLPEHILAGKAMAHAQGVDFWEQDVVLTKDNEIIIVHDLYLERLTDVAELFPKRARKDGKYYAIDFTLEEIKKLTMKEGFDPDTKKQTYPDRYPGGHPQFKISTLKEEIDFLIGLNRSTQKNVGLYLEIKHPFWHEKEGKNITKMVLDLLKSYGYDQKGKSGPTPIYIQCFDTETLKEIRQKYKSEIPLVQLIGEKEWGEDDRADNDFLKTAEGLKSISSFVQGIGPWMPQIVKGKDSQEKLQITNLVEEAHKLGLVVHPYTFRKDDLPSYVQNFDELLNIFFNEAHVDGVFSDFPDLAVQFIKEHIKSTTYPQKSH